MGERLKQLRLENGLKLKEVATALNVTIRSINRYEDGTREPSVDLIIKFCKLYKVSADYLLGLTDDY
jgi:transcriptional regulator with XRE-family HTH domain